MLHTLSLFKGNFTMFGPDEYGETDYAFSKFPRINATSIQISNLQMVITLWKKHSSIKCETKSLFICLHFAVFKLILCTTSPKRKSYSPCIEFVNILTNAIRLETCVNYYTKTSFPSVQVVVLWRKHKKAQFNWMWDKKLVYLPRFWHVQINLT